MNDLKKHPYLKKILSSLWSKANAIRLNFIDFKYETKNNPTIPIGKIISYNKVRRLGPKKTICYAPITNMHFRFNGDVNACCFNKNLSFGNISKSSLNEIWNSQKANKLRNYIEDYNLCNGCNFCQKQIEAENFEGLYAQIFDPIPMYVQNKSYPTSMTFEINNTCNLECIMCTGDYSNLIRKNRERKPPQPLLYKDSFIEELKEFLPYLHSANFVGGEPTLIKQYFKIWDEILLVNKKCKIHVQTNGTNIDHKFLLLLESGQFNVGVSIDAINKKTYELIRKNATFEEVINNIEILSDYYQKNKINLWFNYCPMVNNWQEIIPFFEYAELKNIKVNLLTVIIPKYLSIRSINSTEIQNIITHLQNADTLSKENKTTLNNFILQLINWREINKLKELNPRVPNSNSKNEFEECIYNNQMLKSFSIVEISSFLKHLELNIEKHEIEIRDQIYSSLIEEIDFFFDDSLSYLDIGELKDGFDKLIGWEIDKLNLK